VRRNECRSTNEQRDGAGGHADGRRAGLPEGAGADERGADERGADEEGEGVRCRGMSGGCLKPEWLCRGTGGGCFKSFG
jgi:hypothetical protein